MLDRIDLPQGTLDLLILRTLAQRHPGKVSVAPTRAAVLLFSIQMWISLRWRSFLPGLVVAAIALALMFVAIPRGVALFGSLFPWSLPAMAMSPHNPYRPIAVELGLFGGFLVGAVACWHLSRREL
jgi:hypothetical protein